MSYDSYEISEDQTHIRCFSKNGNLYSIEFDDDCGLKCSCNSFKFREHCRHIDNLDFATKKQFAKIKDSERSKKKDNFCRHCGTAFETEDNYCGNCGKERA